MMSIFITGIIISIVLMLCLFLAIYIFENKTKYILNTKLSIVLYTAVVIFSFWLSFKVYTNMVWFNYDNKNTASRGIIFKDTLMLSEHKLIGTSDYYIFKLDQYTRSDRQLEIINVVSNSNKLKD